MMASFAASREPSCVLEIGVTAAGGVLLAGVPGGFSVGLVPKHTAAADVAWSLMILFEGGRWVWRKGGRTVGNQRRDLHVLDTASLKC